MPEFCTCGAQLPPDARFCHRCGKPQREEPLIPIDEPEVPAVAVREPVAQESPRVNFRNPVAVRLSFVSGLLANFLVFMPVLALATPLWLFGAGMLSSTWYMRRTGERLTTRDGFRMGWITAVLSFLVTGILSVTSFVIGLQSGALQQVWQEQIGNLPVSRADADAALQLMSSPAGLITVLLVSLAVMFVVFGVFGVLGGAAGARLSARRRAKEAPTE